MTFRSFPIGQRLIFNKAYYQITMLTSDEVILKSLSDPEEVKFTLEEAEELFRTGVIKLIIHPVKEEINSELLTDISELQSSIVMNRYEYVKAAEARYPRPQIVGLEEIILNVSARIGDELPPSNLTLYRWWKRWLGSGKQLKSLENKSDGRRGYRKYLSTLNDIFYEVVNDVYLTRERQSKQEVYLSLKSRIKQYNHVNKTTIVAPSRATVYRMLNDLDDYTVTAERYGIKAAKKKYRTSGKGVATTYPLERVEIDHTPLDVMVIDEKTELTIGRPYLTCILDCHTRLPLAISIGFEPPSELSVIRALRQSIWMKDELIKDVPDLKGTWPAYGIPSLLVCDNGLEFHANNLRRVCGELNIELMFCPKHEPHYKGRIERFLGTLNRQISQRIRGTTFSNILERGDYNSVSEAVVTLKELQHLIYFWVVDIYSQTIHKSIATTPYNKWVTDIARVEPILPISKDQFDLICARKEERTLSHEGIYFERLTYNSETLRVMRMMYGERAKVQIRIDPENLEKIWVYDVSSDSFIEVPCVDQDYAKGLTLLQHKMILKVRIERQKEIEEELADDLMDAKNVFNQKLKELNADKRIKKRSQAARIGILPFTNETNCSDQENAIKSRKPQFFLDDADIPDFDLMDREDEDNE